MEKLDAALAEITTKVAKLAETHGEAAAIAAWKAAGDVLQMTAARSIVFGAAGLLTAIVAGGALWWICKNNDEFEGDGAIGCGMATFCFAALGFVIAIFNLTDPVTWVAATNPDFAIAAKALGKL